MTVNDGRHQQLSSINPPKCPTAWAEHFIGTVPRCNLHKTADSSQSWIMWQPWHSCNQDKLAAKFIIPGCTVTSVHPSQNRAWNPRPVTETSIWDVPLSHSPAIPAAFPNDASFQFCLICKFTAVWLRNVIGLDPWEFWTCRLQWALGELSRLGRHPSGPYSKEILHHLPHSTCPEASGSPTR